MNTPPPATAVDLVPALIRGLYAIVSKLESIFPGRHFTPDGHLVGSIGEALGSTFYGVELCRASTEGYDGVSQGRKVEVKATQGERIALSSCPEHLLAFKPNEDGSFAECFNGPGDLAWALVAKRRSTKNGQHQVSLAALKRVMATAVTAAQVLEPARELQAGTKRAPAARPTAPS